LASFAVAQIGIDKDGHFNREFVRSSQQLLRRLKSQAGETQGSLPIRLQLRKLPDLDAPTIPLIGKPEPSGLPALPGAEGERTADSPTAAPTKKRQAMIGNIIDPDGVAV